MYVKNKLFYRRRGLYLIIKTPVTHLKMSRTVAAAACSLCETTEGINVWYADDGYGYPCLETLRCQTCPKPDNVFIDEYRKYNPDVDDKKFGIKDYDIPLSYTFCGTDDVYGQCFECDQKCNLSKGYGHEYVPDSLWADNNRCDVVFCQECFRERRKNHKSFDDEKDLNGLEMKLTLYWENRLNNEI